MHTTSRRSFLKALGAGSVLAGLGLWRLPAWALATDSQPGVLAGREFDLTIDHLPVNFSGKARQATVINGSLPAPLLRWREGDTVTIRVRNRLAEDTSIHWHGILLPADMDGVPGFSFAGIAPDGLYEYRFKVKQSGTYWYHSHSGFQEQLGVYGPLVIDPLTPEPFQYERDYVLLFSDWTDEHPAAVLASLKKQADYYNQHRRTLGDFIEDVSDNGWGATVRERLAWATMNMTPTDIADVTAATYRYLLNGRTAQDNWTALYRPGERIRLRLINASAMSYLDFRIPGLKLTVVAADGQNVEPVEVDELRLAVAETYDVIVTPDASQSAWTLFAQTMGRDGYARGTLAVSAGLQAPVPALDPRPELSMEDMGHGGHGSHGAHGGHGAAAAVAADPHAGHAGHAVAADPHAAHAAAPAATLIAMQGHPASEEGNPLVDMQTQAPTHKLDDPGIGLRNNGRRVLTYRDLRSRFADPDGRAPGRTIELHLTGHMERYSWSIDGVPFAHAEPIRLKYGERVRIVLVNDTMMHHPIHLHGLWSDLEDEYGNFRVRKHTIDMPPGSIRSYRVTADALGRWAYHCHLLMHMDLGMFREVRVEE